MRKHTFRVAMLTLVPLVSVAMLILAAPPASAANVKSTKAAGWSLYLDGGYLQGTAKFKVPTFTCPDSGMANFSIIVTWSTGGAPSANAELTASVLCNNGVETYSASIQEYDPNGFEGRYINVSPGDVLSASFTFYPEAGVLKLAGRNVTTTQAVSVTGHAPDSLWHNATYTFNADGTPIPSFTTIPFSNLTLDSFQAFEDATTATGINLWNGAMTHQLVRAGQPLASLAAFNDVFVNAS